MVRVRSMDLHVEVRGRGRPPLLMLHGYLASSEVWAPAARLLASRVLTAAVDLPGCGYSDRPAGAPYTTPWFADLLPEVCDALDLQAPVLVAHSLGAAVCLHAALRHAHRYRGLVLVSPPVYDPPPPPGLRSARRHPRMARRFFASRAGRALISWLVRRAAFSDGDAFESGRVDRMLGHLDSPGGWDAATTIGLRAAAPPPARLREVDLPTLVCWGARDRVHPVEAAERLRDDIGPRARLAVEPDAGHNVHEERAAWFAEMVLDWLGSQH